VFVDRLAAALSERSHAVTVFTFAPPAEPRSYAVQALRPRAAADHRIVRLYLAPWLLNLRPFDRRFDVAHLHGDDWFYIYRRLPTVRTFYGSALMEAVTATALRRKVHQSAIFALELIANRLASASYGIAPDSEMLFQADGILSCGVTPPAAPRRPEATPTILFVGTWEGRKRGKALHRTFQEHVRARLPDAQLWMVSDYAEPGPGVVWYQRPSEAELADLYGRAWVFSLPSSYEGLGLPYLQAMANGIPVVATPNPGAQYVLEAGRSGVIVDLEDLGEALVQTLKDGALREKLQTAGWRRIEDFSWERVVDEYERAYATAIQRWHS